MNDTIPCLQTDAIESLLAGELTPDELTTAEEHLARCGTCRQRIERTIGSPEWWEEACQALAGSDQVALDDGGSMNGTQSGSPADRLLAVLGPSDDPSMLGRIGSYEVVGLIGSGGMGVVFKGFDAALNRYVAIKMLLPHLATSGASRKRFAREARAAAAVVDDHVMPIHYVAQWQGAPYFVMPYTRGLSLQKRLDQEGPLELREILRIGLQTARGLAAAHAQGLVHRDIKPANILLDEGVERAALVDFGLARAVDDASLTQSGMLAGTPRYMSPEQARGETVDQRSDLFSLGSVLYAMCAGHAPFRGDTSYGVLRRITDEEPRPIREINADIPQWLCRIIARLMSKDPAERFGSAREVARLLEECLAHVQRPTEAPLPSELAEPSASPSVIQSRTRKGVFAMTSFIIFLGMSAMMWQGTAPPDISGQWTGDQWSSIVLEPLDDEPNWYTGRYVSAEGNRAGTLQLSWSRLQQRFNGQWKESGTRYGDLSIRVTESGEIRGALTVDAAVEETAAVPRLRDFVWTRKQDSHTAPSFGARDIGQVPGTTGRRIEHDAEMVFRMSWRGAGTAMRFAIRDDEARNILRTIEELAPNVTFSVNDNMIVACGSMDDLKALRPRLLALGQSKEVKGLPPGFAVDIWNSSDYSEENDGTAPGMPRDTTLPEFFPELKVENNERVLDRVDIGRTDAVGLLEGSDVLPKVIRDRIDELGLVHLKTERLRFERAAAAAGRLVTHGEARLFQLSRPVGPVDGAFDYLLVTWPKSGPITYAYYRSPEAATDGSSREDSEEDVQAATPDFPRSDTVPLLETTIPELYPELKVENMHHVVWGETAGGLQAGIGFFGTDRRTYRVGEELSIAVKLRNISDDSVQISHSTARLRFVRPEIEDSRGKRLQIDMPPAVRYVFPKMEVLLEPGEETTFGVVKINLAAGRAKRTGIPHVDVPPGEYTIRYGVPLESPAPLQTGELRFAVTEAAATTAIDGGGQRLRLQHGVDGGGVDGTRGIDAPEVKLQHLEGGEDLALAVNPDETVLGDNIRIQRLERVAAFATSPEGHNQLRVRRERGASVSIRPGDVSDTALLPLTELVTSVEYEIGWQTREIRTRQPFNYLFVSWPESGPITWIAYRSPQRSTDGPSHEDSEEDERVAKPDIARTDTVGLLEGSKYLPTVLTHRVHELELEHVVTLLGSLQGQEAVRVPTEGGFVVLEPGEARLMELNRPVDSTTWYAGDERKKIRAREPFNYLLAMRPESGPVTWAAYRSPEMPTQLPRGREGGEARSDAGRSDGASPDRADRLTAESEELLKLAQGTWERQVTESADPTERMVKEIKGNTEVFSIYKGDTLTYQQVVDFDIDVRDGVAVFTMRNMRVTAGPRKGHEGSGQFSYTFQIRNNKWIEAQGLMDGDGAAPKLSIYERVGLKDGVVIELDEPVAEPPRPEEGETGAPGSQSSTDAIRPDITVGRGERLVHGNPASNSQWSESDRALREAMDADPTYTTGTGEGLTQQAAIAAWRRLLERDDLTEQQRAFAWWRIGSLYAYNFDPGRGETASHEKAEQALAKARELFGNLVTVESLNSATVWATISGSEEEKAKRLATAFNWLFTRGEDDIQRSVELVNRNGSVIDKKFFPHIARQEATTAQRIVTLRDQVLEHQAIITKAVAESIQYFQNPEATAALLKSIEGVADPDQIEQWRRVDAQQNDGAEASRIAELPAAGAERNGGAVSLEGQWQAETIDGRAVSRPTTLMFSDGKVDGLFRLVDAASLDDRSTRESRELTRSFEFRVFRQGEFNAIDIDAGGNTSSGFRGIYKIEGDILTMAFRPKLDARTVSPWVDKQGRPNTFDPDRVVLRVFRRILLDNN